MLCQVASLAVKEVHVKTLLETGWAPSLGGGLLLLREERRT